MPLHLAGRCVFSTACRWYNVDSTPDPAKMSEKARLDPNLLCKSMMTSISEAVFKSVVVETHKGRELEVRSFARDDFGALVQMYKSFEPKRVAQGLPPPDVPRIAHWLDRLEQKSQALLAWEGRKVVAHTILCPMPADAVEFTIFVHQDYREEGLGTALSRHTLSWAMSMGFTHAYLTTETSNFRALRLFRKLGFHTTSSYGDEVEMNLALPPFDCERPRAA
jgi:GNAT superfamily N-acetyltransferase